MKLSSLERVQNTLNKKSVDRIPAMISPWPETILRWRNEGHIGQDEDVFEHFDADIRFAGILLNSVADLDHKDIIIEENENTVVKLDGNGAKLRWHKTHTTTPEHIDFAAKDREGWLEKIKPHLLDLDRRRIPFEDYRLNRKTAREKNRFFCWRGMAPFEQITRVCGHEHFLMGMALDPEWCKDVALTYAHFTINHMETLFAEEGLPDGIFFYEDMGYKGKPFMSPTMYREILQPGHKLLFDYAHSIGCKVIVHSCGFVEPLVPGLIQAGMNCLQAMEVKAGMDLPGLFDKYGTKIAFFGGIDVRTLISNDPNEIVQELINKMLPVVSKGGSYILHSDHSEPPQIDYQTMVFFLKKGREIGLGAN